MAKSNPEPPSLADVNHTESGNFGVVRMLPAASFQRQHRLHVLLFNIVPAVATLFAFLLMRSYPPRLYHITIALAGWYLTGIGVTVGYHRLFTHRSFEAFAIVRWTLAILGSMAGQGPVSAWLAIHRRHHEHSDVDGDPHSPNVSRMGWRQHLQGLWHAHVGWLQCHDVPNPVVYAPDVFKDRVLITCNRYYVLLVLLGMIVPAIIVSVVMLSWKDFWLTLLWAGGVRLFVTSQFIFAINSICHAFGFQSHATGDESRNNLWLALPTLGESWHNNHHAHPTSARFGHNWWQIDLGYGVIWVLKKLGLVFNVNQPQKDSVQETT